MFQHDTASFRCQGQISISRHLTHQIVQQLLSMGPIFSCSVNGNFSVLGCRGRELRPSFESACQLDSFSPVRTHKLHSGTRVSVGHWCTFDSTQNKHGSMPLRCQNDLSRQTENGDRCREGASEFLRHISKQEAETKSFYLLAVASCKYVYQVLSAAISDSSLN